MERDRKEIAIDKYIMSYGSKEGITTFTSIISGNIENCKCMIRDRENEINSERTKLVH